MMVQGVACVYAFSSVYLKKLVNYLKLILSKLEVEQEEQQQINESLFTVDKHRLLVFKFTFIKELSIVSATARVKLDQFQEQL